MIFPKHTPSEVVAWCPHGTLVPVDIVLVDGAVTWNNAGGLRNLVNLHVFTLPHTNDLNATIKTNPS
jgi:hypothetical protein